MKHGIITYHHPHLKTEQVLLDWLHRYGADKLEVFALPFTPRPARKVLIDHRPDMNVSAMPEDIALANGIPYHRVERDTDIPTGLDYYHVLVGTILSPEFVSTHRTINCHSGIIPAVRGLDGVKWALYEKKPLGVTLHFIDEQIDAGEIITVLPTPVYPTDTLASLCRRHYENELHLTCNFEHYLTHPVNDFKDVPTGEARRRMGRSMEQEIIDQFDDYKRAVAK